MAWSAHFLEVTIHRSRVWIPLVVSALFAAAAAPRAQVAIRSLTDVIEGHHVGGVTIDLVGNIYVADFGDVVWKITPEGQRQEFASGFYGASGNAIDHEGNLLQANAYGDSITKVDRRGHTAPFVTNGLSTPIGIAIDRQTGAVYVANCGSNSITKIVVEVDPRGMVSMFATVSDKGLGHLCFKDDRFYVTAHESHQLYQVKLDGTVTRILGKGERGVVDGVDDTALLSFPNGIACDPWARRLYINEYVNNSTSALPRRTIVREIRLEADK